MNQSRRQFLTSLGVLAALWPLRGLSSAPGGSTPGNFLYVYSDEAMRKRFRDFLVNVFHLYPEDALHEAIHRQTSAHLTDASIYRELQQQLPELKPLLSELTFALPALAKQKAVMAAQTAELVDSRERIVGYLEIGSNGRYLDALEERLRIRGPRYYVSPTAPGYSLIDMLDRGQINKGAEFIALDDYRMDLSSIAPASLDLVTVYIGFHHCPVPLRQAFFDQIRNVMKPGAAMILRDHDVRNEDMWRMVALAHDVFNMGTKESWNFNVAERRHFYSLATLDEMLLAAGFRSDGRRLLQDGDPTLNTLMLYRKV